MFGIEGFEIKYETFAVLYWFIVWQLTAFVCSTIFKVLKKFILETIGGRNRHDDDV